MERSPPAAARSPHGAANCDQLGSAIHGYFALAVAEMDAAGRLRAAQRLLAHWGAASVVEPGVVVEVGERMSAFLALHSPGAKITTEPWVAWRNADHQLMEGWD